MRRLIVIVASVAIGALALSACSGGASETKAQQAYVATVSLIPALLQDDSSSQMLALGNGVCSDLTSGNSVSQEITSMEDAPNSPLTPYQDGEVLGAAITGLCPQFTPQLQQYDGQ